MKRTQTPILTNFTDEETEVLSQAPANFCQGLDGLDFAGQMVSVSTVQPCHCGTKAAEGKQMCGCGW